MTIYDRTGLRLALFGYVAAAFILMFPMLAIVHPHPIERNAMPRWLATIERWYDTGYFKQGGMQFYTYEEASNLGYQVPSKAAVKPTTVFVWKNTTMGWLQGANVLERLCHLLTGRFSPRLMVLHNQGIVALSSALLGMLAMLLAAEIGLPTRLCYLLGLACLVVHQTFPLNLNEYLDFYPAPLIVLLALALLVWDAASRRHSPERSGAVPFLIALLMLYVEPVTAGLFLLSFVVVRAFLDPLRFRWIQCVTLLAAPAAIAYAILKLQRALVALNYPDAVFVGSELGFRTGFDGDRAYYFNQWDLVTRKFINTSVHTELAALCRWETLFVAGALSVAILTILYMRDRVVRYPVQIVFNLIGLSVPFVFIFSQAAVIHPYEYDLFAVLPCILAAFCLLPAYVDAKTGTTRLPTLIAATAAICLIMVHLRTYAAAMHP
jgi:hypothetical protein